MFAFACGGSGDESGGGRRFLSIGTAPPGGAFFVVGGALGEVLNQFGGEQWEVTAEATQGTMETFAAWSPATSTSPWPMPPITYFAVRGEEGLGQGLPDALGDDPGAQTSPYSSPRKCSGVTSIAALKENRVVVGPAGAGFEYFVKPILAAHEVTYDDFTPLNGPQSQAVDMLADGSAAAAFLGGAVPTASITQAASSQDIFFIPFDAGGEGRAHRRLPVLCRGDDSGRHLPQPGRRLRRHERRFHAPHHVGERR